MVTTRSKSSKFETEVVSDISIQQTNKSVSKPKKTKTKTGGSILPQLIIFVSLLLDLLAFTLILPLFPSILQYYTKNESQNGLYAYLENKIEYVRKYVGAPSDFNIILYGGFLGSMFSFLQFVASPIVGAFSDVYGRKIIILLCLVGIAISYGIWSVASSFLLFVISRIIGGISKGNLSISMAAMADISSSEERASGMALIGAAFSIGFIVGPLLGVFGSGEQSSENQLWFTRSALICLGLVILDILFVLIFFKETLPKEKRMKSIAGSLKQASAYVNVKDLFQFTAVKGIPLKELKQLRALGLVYFIYMFLYSGLEFTLSYLVFHKFNYTKMEQGWMFFEIGFVMALLQGIGVRKIPADLVQKYASLGLLLTIPSFLCIGFAPNRSVLKIGVFIYAVSTSLVVPCMTTIVSKYGSASQKGTSLGIFRSLGALARAIGPIVASIAYWIVGSTLTYCVGGILLIFPWYLMRFTSNLKT